MGQHLRLYASNSLTVSEVKKWCHARAFELTEIPSTEDQPMVAKVEKEMVSLRYSRGNADHLEHWSNWCGPVIWDFLVWDAHVCDNALIDRAISAAAFAHQAYPGLRSRYPNKDFTNDTPIEFLRHHIGCVVWGDNDGI